MSSVQNDARLNYLLNDMIQFWITFPDASFDETISFLRREGLLERPQAGFKYFFRNQKNIFDSRFKNAIDDPIQNRIDMLPKEDMPLGANPFMN